MKRLYFIITLLITGTTPNVAFTAENIQAGNYLASRFAQSNHDWSSANKFIYKLISTNNAPDNILQRAMILSMGSGDAEKAISIAKQMKSKKDYVPNTVTEIFLIADAFKNKNYKKAHKILTALPNDGTTRFISPFIEGWLSAAQGQLNIANLRNNTIQLYHGILISDFLENHKDIEKMIDRSLKVDEINIIELEQIAELYAHIGIKDKALDLYEMLFKNNKSDNIKNKITNLKQGTNKVLFSKVTTANYGMATALHDISNILNSEQNDESARVFANIALYLEPQMANTKFLLAEINTNHNQYETAISYYASINKSNEKYIKAQHKIVDIYETTMRFDDAISLLEALPQDTDTLIKTGDLHRSQSNFGFALKSYDKAIEKIGGVITPEYWHLHYVRGIAYEQLDNWKRAEEELKAALSFQPDHPYILNYLGYAWADKGVNLEQSLEMIKRAVNLRPSDGYITDSLGWVMYRVKDYHNAVPVLERAAQLLPYDPTVNDHLGDAYLKVGRILEARFQWMRAKNHSEDEEQIKKIEEKLSSGIKKLK